MLILEVSFLVLSVVLTVGIVWFASRKKKWNPYVTATIGLVLFFSIIASVSFVVFAGPLMPIEAWTNRWKVATFERHIYAGESRATLEENFGKSIPMPDLRSCCWSTTRQNQPGLEIRHERYYYFVSGAFCISEYKGVAVRFDLRDRVISWRRVAMADGC